MDDSRDAICDAILVSSERIDAPRYKGVFFRVAAVSAFGALAHLRRWLRFCYADPEFIRKEVGVDRMFPDAESYYQREFLPHRPTTRMGDFGEALMCIVAERIHGFDVPLMKLRNKPNPDLPLHGTDNLGFKYRETHGHDEVHLAEAKCRRSHAISAVREACDDLSAADLDRAVTFTSHALFHERNPKYEKLSRFLDPYGSHPVNRSHGIYAIIPRNSNKHRQRLRRSIDRLNIDLENTTVNVLEISGLVRLVRKCYTKTP